MAPSLSRRLSAAAFIVLAGILPATASAELVFGVTNQNFLTSFDSATPGTLLGGVQITGLAQNELIMGIDFRPANGQLYGMGSQNRLYTINTTTGVATAVGGTFAPPASGVEFGFDFNPVVDAIRVISDAEQNFRLNPGTGAVAGTDTNLAYIQGDNNFGQDPSIVAAAYNNNTAGATSTTLFVLDARFNTLARQGSVGGTPSSPNTGQLSTIGALGVDFVEMAGFDISGISGTAYAALLGAGSNVSALYTINLTTGAATSVGSIGGGLFIRDITVVPGPSSVVLIGAAASLAAARRRRDR